MCGGSSSVTDFSSKDNMVEAKPLQVRVTRDGPELAGAFDGFCNILYAPKMGRRQT